MLMMLRLSLRVAEVCSLKCSSINWSHGRWTRSCKIKGGKEEVWPLPKDVKEAIDHYLKLDRKRRELVHSNGEEAHLFQPHSNYRTLQFDKGISSRMVHNIVRRWASFGGIGDVSPHDLRSYSHHSCSGKRSDLPSGADDVEAQRPEDRQRHDHGRENLDQNAVNFLQYEEE